MLFWVQRYTKNPTYANFYSKKFGGIAPKSRQPRAGNMIALTIDKTKKIRGARRLGWMRAGNTIALLMDEGLIFL